MAAFVIDLATVLALLWACVVLRIFWLMDTWSGQWQPPPWGRGFVATVTYVALHALYMWVFTAHNRGQTPGRDIMKVRLIGDRRETPSGAQALVRWLPIGAALLVRPVWLAVAVLATLAAPILTPARRSFPDLVARTRVVDYDRDAEDPDAKRPMPRRRRRQLAAEEEESAMPRRNR